MEIKDLKEKSKGIFSGLGKSKKNKYIAAALFLGVALLLIPTGSTQTKNKNVGVTEPSFSLAEQEKRIADVLSRISGAGQVDVVLTLKSGMERVLAENEDKNDSGGKVSHVTIQTGSGTETVTLRYIYPIYQGALIVCKGAGSPNVRLEITQAVAALTGLTTDKITVTKMN